MASDRHSLAGSRLAAALVAFAAAWSAITPDAEATWRLFHLGPEVRAGGGGIVPEAVAPLPDGGILIALSYGDEGVYLRRPSGGLQLVVGGGEGPLTEGGSATAGELAGPRGLSLAPDGSVLIADGHLIRRLTAHGRIFTVAGTAEGMYGEAGWEGDGGPATAARLCSPSDVAALPGGGFLIADSSNGLVRKVGPDGTMATVAGSRDPAPDAHPCSAGSDPDQDGELPDGAEATSVQLSYVDEVDPLPDGGFLFGSGGRVHRVTPDGRLRALGAPPGWSAAVLPGSRIALSTQEGILAGPLDGPLVPVAGGGAPPRELFGLGAAVSFAGLFRGEGRDARDIGLGGELVADPFGGLLVDGEGPLGFVTELPSGRMGIAVRRVKAAARRATLTYVATAAASVELVVRRGRRRAAPLVRAPIESGLGNLALPRVPPDGYIVALRATASNGTRDSDRLGVVLGGRLPLWVAADAIAATRCECTGDAPDTTEYLGRCRRFSRTRVDCRINHREIETCEHVGSAELRPSGLVWTRGYGCPMRRHARRSGPTAAPLL